MTTKTNKIIWVGSRQSDIRYAGDFFSGSITLYGDNLNHNISLCKTSRYRISNNVPSELRDNFICEQIEKQVKEEPASMFMFYDPYWIIEISGLERFKEHFLCVNDFELIKSIESKIIFRNEYSSLINIVEACIIESDKLTRELLESFFVKFGVPLVFQKEVSNGGSGTFFISKSNIDLILSHNAYATRFIVSKYKEDNIPVNVHLIIYDNYICVLPASVQIIELENHCLLYKGGDYLSFRALEESKKAEFYNKAKELGEVLQRKGYRGICGVDALFDKSGKLYVMEINPRFQGSSNILDKALTEQGFDCLAKMNYEAFANKSASKVLDENCVNVNYSSYSLINNAFGNKTLSNKNFKEELGCVSCEMDGLDDEQIIGNDIYFCKLVLDRAIFGGTI